MEHGVEAGQGRGATEKQEGAKGIISKMKHLFQSASAADGGEQR